VIPTQKFGHFELETTYEPQEITQEQKQSQEAEDLKTCLRAGVIPDAYQVFIKDIKIVEVPVYEEIVTKEPPSFVNEAQRIEYAKGGFYVLDLERNLVYCPGGERPGVLWDCSEG
jgi:transposase